MIALAVRVAVSSPGTHASTCSLRRWVQTRSSLGSDKVIGRSLNLENIASKEDYWNVKQAQYSPSCVIYPGSAQNVSTSLKTIKKAGSRFAIKAGGHNPNTYFSTVDNGVLIDLAKTNTRTYDKSTTIGTYQPEGTSGDVYTYFAKYGRTVVGARLAGVGTGLVLGGGLSFLYPQYGMACDSFRELEVVLPNGNIVKVSPTQNPDLFFAMRGGRGNAYGVVTKYTIQTRPAGAFYAGNVIYAFDQADAVAAAARNFTLHDPVPKPPSSVPLSNSHHRVVANSIWTRPPSCSLSTMDLMLVMSLTDSPPFHSFPIRSVKNHIWRSSICAYH